MLFPFEIALRDALRKRADDKDAEKLRAAQERANKVKRDSLGLPIDADAPRSDVLPRIPGI